MSYQALGNSQVGNAVPGWCALGGWSLPPPGFPKVLVLTAIIPSRVAFGATKLSLNLSLQYIIPSRVAFGSTALIQRSYISVFLNGVDVSELVLVNSVQITDPLSNSTTASFALWDKHGTVVPQVGQEVLIYLGGQRIFGGSVEQPFQTSFQANPGFLYAGSGASGSGGVSSATGSINSGGVNCTDFSNLLDRRYVGLYFDGHGAPAPTFLSDVVQYIVQQYFAQDGITYDDSDGDPGIDLGPTLFNWVTGRAAFNTLSSVTGWDFSVDQFKVLRFFPSASGLSAAAFNIADNDGNVYAESLGVEYYRSKYRNRQGIISPSQQSALWIDTYSTAIPGPFPNQPQPPDGIRRTFEQLYGFTAVPIVAVNGVPQVVAQLLSVGGFSPSSGFQWYIIQPAAGLPSFGLYQNPANPALTSSDTLTISYPSPVQFIYWVQNDSQIAARATIEGNSGIYEDVEQAPSVTDPDAIAAYAAGLLARYGNGIPFQVTYSSRNQKGLFSGQLQHIQITNPPLNFTGLISNVTWQDVDGKFMQIGATVLSGEYQGDFTQFFAALVAQTALPQPSNTSVYQWFIESTGTQNYITPQVALVNSGVEAILSVTINFTTDNPAPCLISFTLLQNGVNAIVVDVPAGWTGPFTVYPTPGSIKLFAGDVLAIKVFFSVLFLTIEDVSIQANTVVLNT